MDLRSRGEAALFAGDLLHSPLQIAHPDVTSCFCEDPARAAESRLRLLADAADRGALVLPAHFHHRGAARITRTGGGFTVSGWAAHSPQQPMR